MAHTYGLEVFVRRALTERLGGFVSYTLSRSNRAVGRLEGPSSFDRTHVFNAAVAYDLGRAWRAGIRTVVYTGIPAELEARRDRILGARVRSAEHHAARGNARNQLLRLRLLIRIDRSRHHPQHRARSIVLNETRVVRTLDGSPSRRRFPPNCCQNAASFHGGALQSEETGWVSELQ